MTQMSTTDNMRGQTHPTRIRERALALRSEGYSLFEIAQLLNISRGTVRQWVHAVPLDEIQRERLKQKVVASGVRGRPLAVIAWQKKIEAWKQEFARITHRWDQDGETLKRFWSDVTRIPLARFSPPYADRRTKDQPTRRAEYRGVCCVTYLSTTLQYTLQAIGESVLNFTTEENSGEDAVCEPNGCYSERNWWSRRDLNPRPSACHADALPRLSYCPVVESKPLP